MQGNVVALMSLICTYSKSAADDLKKYRGKIMDNFNNWTYIYWVANIMAKGENENENENENYKEASWLNIKLSKEILY